MGLLAFPKLCPQCEVLKTVNDFSKSSARKDGLTWNCRDCQKAYRIANADARKKLAEAYSWKDAIRTRERYLKNTDAIKAKVDAWRKNNPEKHKAGARRRRANNLERARRWAREYGKRYPEKANANTAKRRSLKLNATPPWADLLAIKQMYKLAKNLALITGKTFHVDHIVPLRSKLVCGLHCIANLQILEDTENFVKGNRHWPDMP